MKRLSHVILKSLIAASFIAFSSLQASTPTMEGLFRNGANAEIGGEVTHLQFVIEEKNNDLLMEKLKLEGNEPKLAEILALEKMPAKYIEIFLIPEGARNYDALMVEHAQKSFDGKILRVEFMSGFSSRLKKDGNTNRNLLYSLIMMQGANESDPIIRLLKSLDKGFELNREIMNGDKVALLKRYQKYLSVTKNDRTMRAEMESPLNPNDDSKKQYVSSVEKSRMYRLSPNVKLIRENSLFFWLINLEKIQARFFSDSHQLDYLKLSVGEGQIEVNCSDYILFDGRFKLPRFFMFKEKGDRLYKISWHAVKTLNKSTFKVQERLDKLKSSVSEKAAATPSLLY